MDAGKQVEIKMRLERRLRAAPQIPQRNVKQRMILVNAASSRLQRAYVNIIINHLTASTWEVLCVSVNMVSPPR